MTKNEDRPSSWLTVAHNPVHVVADVSNKS